MRHQDARSVGSCPARHPFPECASLSLASTAGQEPTGSQRDEGGEADSPAGCSLITTRSSPLRPVQLSKADGQPPLILRFPPHSLLSLFLWVIPRIWRSGKVLSAPHEAVAAMLWDAARPSGDSLRFEGAMLSLPAAGRRGSGAYLVMVLETGRAGAEPGRQTLGVLIFTTM